MKGLKSVKDLGASDAGNFTGKAGTLLHKPDKAGSLELFWKSRVSEITHAFVALTDKERGMLGRLIKLCPPGKAIAVVEIVLADWPFYAKRVQSAAGLPYVPMSPQGRFPVEIPERGDYSLDRSREREEAGGDRAAGFRCRAGEVSCI